MIGLFIKCLLACFVAYSVGCLTLLVGCLLLILFGLGFVVVCGFG